MGQIIQGDCIEEMKKLPPKSVHVIVTSPPYFGLRDYQHDDQIGREKTVGKYIDKMVKFASAAHRVLRDDGTFWLNIGDKYNNGRLLLIPHRLVFAFENFGWELNRDIIWKKDDPRPESPIKRPSTSHEYIFMFSKQGHNYYYDRDGYREPLKSKIPSNPTQKTGFNETGRHSEKGRNIIGDMSGRLARSVWELKSERFLGDHYAAFPRDLPSRIIQLATSEAGACSICGSQWGRLISPEYYKIEGKDVKHTKTIGWNKTCFCNDEHIKRSLIPSTVLDPFMGSGTTALAAIDHGRNYIGIEIVPKNIEIINKRIFEATQQQILDLK